MNLYKSYMTPTKVIETKFIQVLSDDSSVRELTAPYPRRPVEIDHLLRDPVAADFNP